MKLTTGKKVALAVGAVVAVVVVVCIGMYIRDTIDLRRIEADNERRAHLPPPPPVETIAEAPKPPPPKGPTPSGPSCETVKEWGNCVEYGGARKKSPSDAKDECRAQAGRWSEGPCSRESATGVCVYHQLLTEGIVEVTYAKDNENRLFHARASCHAENGTYTSLQ